MPPKYLFLIIVLFYSCTLLPPPKKIEEVKPLLSKNVELQFFDLKHDGRDELFWLDFGTPGFFKSKIHIVSDPGNTFNIEREFSSNYNFDDFAVHDLNGDKQNYFLATFKEDSSLYLYWKCLFDSSSNKKILTTGRNKKRDADIDFWDGNAYIHSFYDINRDGYDDAVILLSLSYDYGERGIVMFDIKNDSILWKYQTAVSIINVHLEDIDKNGGQEVFIDNNAPMNGLKVNGSDDKQPYYIVLDQFGKELRKEKIPINGGKVYYQFQDFDGDGNKEVVRALFGSFSEGANNSRIEWKRWGEPSWKVLKDIPEGIKSGVFYTSAINKSLSFIYVTGNKKYLNVISDNFKRSKSYAYSFLLYGVSKITDIDRDGEPNFLVSGTRNKLILNHNFNTLAETEFSVFYSAKTGANRAYELYGLSGQKFSKVKLVANIDLYLLLGKYLLILLPWLILIYTIVHIKKQKKRQVLPFTNNASFNHLSSGLIILDKEKKVKLINKQATTILNIHLTKIPVALSELEKQMPQDLVKEINEGLNHPPSKSFKYTYAPAKEVKHLFFNISMIYNDHTEFLGYIISIEDLTEVIHSQRAFAWASIAQHMAHDIKNPLSNVRLTLERMKLDLDNLKAGERRQIEKYIKSIDSDVHLVRNVTNSFMQFSNLSKPKISPTDVHSLIDGIIKKRVLVTGSRIKFKKVFSEKISKVEVDASLFARAIENVLDNSIKAINGKGTIIFSTSLIELVNPKNNEVKSYFEIEIEDTGRGIAKDLVDKIFEPFVSHTDGGTGLGLAIVKKIVNDHNGEITLHSKFGVGTKLCLRFPIFG
jgi:nitrogen-specific signal transduction histidine kinase